MNSKLNDRLFELLPKYDQRRDLENGQPLRSLLAVLGAEYSLLEQDIEALYDNWFIETCDPWTIPYIADLIGIRDLREGHYWHPTERRRVANTIGYRRRKGTLATLEHVICDVTGWDCHVAEAGRQVIATEHARRPRIAIGQTVDVRQRHACDNLEGPFNVIPHGVELPTNSSRADARGPQPGRRLRTFHPQGLCAYVWRLRPIQVLNAAPGLPTFPKAGDIAPPNCFTFDPWGRDAPLFRNPDRVQSISVTTSAAQMPARIKRSILERELESRPAKRLGDSLENNPEVPVYGPECSLQVLHFDFNNKEENWTPILPAEVLSADLSHWPTLSEQLLLAHRNPGKLMAVDVERGRFVLLPRGKSENQNHAVDTVRVNYTYAFSDNIGAHPCSRAGDWGAQTNANIEIEVAQGTKTDPNRPAQVADFDLAVSLFEDLVRFHRSEIPTLEGQARELWEQLSLKRQLPKQHEPVTKPIVGVIRFMDNSAYSFSQVRPLVIPPFCQLTLTAAVGMRPTLRTDSTLEMDSTLQVVSDWPSQTSSTSEQHSMNMSQASENQSTGETIDGSEADSHRLLRLENLAIDTALRLNSPTDSVLRVEIESCTLRPGSPTPAIDGGEGDVDLRIQTSLMGPVRLSPKSCLTAADSIFDAGPDDSRTAICSSDTNAVALASGPAIDFQRVTVLGKTRASRLSRAEDCLFSEPVVATNCKPQSVRYSYLHPHSRLLLDAPSRATLDATSATTPRVLDLVHCSQASPPIFVARRFGDPAYAQLAWNGPQEFLRGGSNGSELGAFSRLCQPQRWARLQQVLQEYLPLGQDLSIQFIT